MGLRREGGKEGVKRMGLRREGARWLGLRREGGRWLGTEEGGEKGGRGKALG